MPLATAAPNLLLEFERRELSVDPHEVVTGVLAAGWCPIVAHPEFIAAMAGDVQLTRALVETGALLQITGMTITGEFGLEAREYAATLLDSGLVHFVASDCHGLRRRPPGLKAAFARIKAIWGREMAEALTLHNPRAVIENRPVQPLGKQTTKA